MKKFLIVIFSALAAISLTSCEDPDFYGYITVNSIEKYGVESKLDSDYRYDVYCKTNMGDGLHLYTNYAYQVGDTLGSRRQFLGNNLNSSRSMSEANDSLRRVVKSKQVVIDSLSVELAQKNALLKYLTPSK
jgi:opacity protein-like surface antigen